MFDKLLSRAIQHEAVTTECFQKWKRQRKKEEHASDKIVLTTDICCSLELLN